MANRYFKKLSPSTDAIINLQGQPTAIRFDTLDHVLGYYGTDSDPVQAELLRLIKEQRGGITEVSEQEYMENYAQKKTTNPRLLPVWREELSRSAGLGLVNREINAQAGGASLDALAVKGRSDTLPRNQVPIRMESPSSAPAAQAPAPVGEPPKEEFKPTLGKRTNVPRPNKNRPGAKN